MAISAVTGEGIEHLLARIEARLSEDKWQVRITVPVTEGELLAWLHRSTEVMERHDGDDGVHLVLRVPPRQKVPFKQRAGRYIQAPARGSRRAGAA